MRICALFLLGVGLHSSVRTMEKDAAVVGRGIVGSDCAYQSREYALTHTPNEALNERNGAIIAAFQFPDITLPYGTRPVRRKSSYKPSSNQEEYKPRLPGG